MKIKQSNLKWGKMILRYQLIIVLLIFLSSKNVYSQNINSKSNNNTTIIHGQVLEKKNNAPFISVAISIKGSEDYVFPDENGNFELSIPTQALNKAILKTESLGMITQFIPLKHYQNKKLIILLIEEDYITIDGPSLNHNSRYKLINTHTQNGRIPPQIRKSTIPENYKINNSSQKPVLRLK